MASKEQVFAALAARVSGSVPALKTFGRRVRTSDEVQPMDQPAIFIEQLSAQTDGSAGLPGKQLIRAGVIIYAFDDTATGPMLALNGLVDQVEGALRRQPNEPAGPWTTTLGGLVASARATSVEYGGGNGGAQGTAVVFIEILTTS